jgi:hypothetical protein
MGAYASSCEQLAGDGARGHDLGRQANQHGQLAGQD